MNTSNRRSLSYAMVVRGILFLLSCLPLRLLRAIGSILGLVVLHTSKRSGRRIGINLLATGMCNTDEVGKMARKTAMEMGKTMIETLCLVWSRNKAHSAKLVNSVVGGDMVMQAMHNNQPIIFLTPHMSTFELALMYTAEQTTRTFTVLYKPSKSAFINELMFSGRKADNISPVATNIRGVLKLAKCLREGGIVGVLPDSIASSDDGVWVEFFGLKVFATTLAAKLILKNSSAKTFFVATKRVSNGFMLEYIPFILDATNYEIKAAVQQIYRELEKIVLKTPEQYYWSYDRFRVPPYAGSPE